jgi:hypothetical protein
MIYLLHRTPDPGPQNPLVIGSSSVHSAVHVRCRYREKDVNQATQAMIGAAEKLAEQEGRTTEKILEDLLSDPQKIFPLVFTAENLKGLVPESLQPVHFCCYRCWYNFCSVHVDGLEKIFLNRQRSPI